MDKSGDGAKGRFLSEIMIKYLCVKSKGGDEWKARSKDSLIN